MRKTPLVAFVDIDSISPPADSRGALARMLEQLAHERIMLVFCSQRTRAEVERTRQAFGIFHPFITEGGGAVFVPERYFGSDIDSTRKVGGYQAVEFATSYDTVAETVRRAADRLSLGVLGFSDMSVEQVARECGLSLLDARLAKLREYSEPFRLLCANPIAERRLCRALEAAGLTCRQGPEFHLATSVSGPERGIALLTTLYRVAFGGSVLTIARDPKEMTRDVPRDGLEWLERIVHDCDNARAAHSAARAARVAR